MWMNHTFFGLLKWFISHRKYRKLFCFSPILQNISLCQGFAETGGDCGVWEAGKGV
jgi:hypothetical protein